MNIVGVILQFARRRANMPALIEPGREIAYGELDKLVRCTAQHFCALGVQPGQRVALCLKDTASHIVAMLALGWMGGVAVPLDWRAKPAECARLIKELGLAAVLTEAGAPALGEVPNWPMDSQWHDDVAQAQVSGRLLGDGLLEDTDRVFMISATSGSTGAPKFTQMTHGQYYFAMAGMFEIMGLTGIHRFLCTSPLYYSGGRNSAIAHLMRGDAVVFYPSLLSAGEYVELIRRYKITVAVLVPSMVRQLLAIAQENMLLPELAAMFCSGAPLYAEEKTAALRCLSPHFHERYGTSETLAIAVLRPEDFANHSDSVGQPHGLIAVEIVDEGEKILPNGQSGKLRLRGPGVATPLPELLLPAQFRDGWFYPGEIARLDAENFIFIEGRTSDVMMRSGAKIFPAEIEAVLAGHPQVAEAAVLGRRGADHEDIILAFIVPRGRVAAGTLLAHCRTHLTSHKVPRHIFLVETLPRNTAGKIDKMALARAFQTGAEILP